MLLTVEYTEANNFNKSLKRNFFVMVSNLFVWYRHDEKLLKEWNRNCIYTMENINNNFCVNRRSATLTATIYSRRSILRIRLSSTREAEWWIRPWTRGRRPSAPPTAFRPPKPWACRRTKCRPCADVWLKVSQMGSGIWRRRICSLNIWTTLRRPWPRWSAATCGVRRTGWSSNIQGRIFCVRMKHLVFSAYTYWFFWNSTKT